MKSSEFCYWLQGFFEVNGVGVANGRDVLNKRQINMIKRHLAMVFRHDIDPAQGNLDHQSELQAIHDGQPQIGGTGPDGEAQRC